MKINFSNLKISKDFLNRKSYIKNEIWNYLIKIIIQNQNSTPQKKISVTYKKQKNKMWMSRQVNRCLYTSKASSVLKLTNYSRQITKKNSMLGLLQNIKGGN